MKSAELDNLVKTGHLVEALLQATDRLGKCLQELERDREQ